MSESRSSRRLAFCFCNICLLILFINFSSHFAQPLSFSMTEFYPDTEEVVYEGDAGASSGMIELIKFSQYYGIGRATYARPLHLWDTKSLANFTVHFTFIISNFSDPSHYSDGFAFFLAPVGYSIPPNSRDGWLGLFNLTTDSNQLSSNKIVSVEFDTWSNVWDPPEQHIGININQIGSVVYAPCNFSDTIRRPGNVWIKYSATTNNLTVYWTFKENPGPVFEGTTSSLSYHVDLRKVLPEWVTIGFSAAAGVYPERNFISSWDFISDLDSSLESSSKRKEKKKKVFLIAVVAGSILVLMLVVVLCWLVTSRKQRKKHSRDISNDANECSVNTDIERLAFPKRFSFQELFSATNGFANDRRLGQGGSGQVYKGTLEDLGGFSVAVKRIFAEPDQLYEKIFINEVKIISRLIHRNLVQFIGWCHEQGECLLVYAYMPNASLDTHLFGTRTTLQWDNRYKIVSGLTSALHYLHEGAEQCVLHRDIKSANVLLDNDFSTKLGDFGIAKLVDPRFRSQTRGVVGTFGYMAPEYAYEGRLSKESDMFSFGVVALEIACGRRTYNDGDHHLPLFRWVAQLNLAGNILDAADERLEMNYDQTEMKCMLIVGLWCTHCNPKERPKAGQVMKVLQQEAPLPEIKNDIHDYPELPQPQQQSQSTSSLH